ncbi:MAG: type II secretion system minor pseudopilin GspI [Pseudomonadales bacterium]|jgi:general secretion pathway protein I|nr:type II secretion system minor pseudopilin GspI [Pseudomonadales bacterium]
MRRRGPGAGGFTLIEIMVAVGVFAVVSIAVYGRIGEILRQSQRLETRTLATWVAQNRLASLSLEFRGAQEPVPTGRRTDLVTLGGRSWRVAVEIESTSDPNLRRIDVSVSPGERDAVGEGGEAARIIGFVGLY